MFHLAVCYDLAHTLTLKKSAYTFTFISGDPEPRTHPGTLYVLSALHCKPIVHMYYSYPYLSLTCACHYLGHSTFYLIGHAQHDNAASIHMVSGVTYTHYQTTHPTLYWFTHPCYRMPPYNT